MIHMIKFGLLGFALSLLFYTDIEILVDWIRTIKWNKNFNITTLKAFKAILNMRNVLERLE